MIWRRPYGLWLAAWLVATPAVGRPESSPSPPPEPVPSPEPAIAEDSPRASLALFFALTREERNEEAARWVDLSPAQAGRGPELARRLKAVLDRFLWIDLDLVSAESTGDTADGLPPDTDQLGTVRLGRRDEPVRLVRRIRSGGARWLFSQGTVGRIDGWYLSLPDRWVQDHLPEILLKPGPGEVLLWQWGALAILALFGAVGGRLLGWGTRRLLNVVARRTTVGWDDALVNRLRPSLAAGWTLVLLVAFVPLLDLYAPAAQFLHRWILTAGLVVFIFAAWRGVDVAAQALRGSSWGQSSASSLSLVLLGARLAKIALGALGGLVALETVGYSVTGVLAGVGIGGVALALAAQKTIENLFGSPSLAVDQPFRVGDFVKVEDFVGTVEEVGLRSTRVRTLDRTLITIPNGRLADMRLESYTARDRMRLTCTIGVAYETTVSQMSAVLKGLEATLRAHPKIWPDSVVVRFKQFGDSSLDIEVMAWFLTREWGEFQAIRQEVLLRFMEVVEGAGSTFAFPTRTVHMVQDGPVPPP